MSKVITFSTKFPAYHPKAGQPTYFLEKIIESVVLGGVIEITDEQLDRCKVITKDLVWSKYHTIRKGKRWKVGDKFSPRVWSDKPYNSKQIIITPDIEIKKVWNVDLFWEFQELHIVEVVNEDDFEYRPLDIEQVAMNDGLSLPDFISWFNFKEEVFSGQIICWNDKIEY